MKIIEILLPKRYSRSSIPAKKSQLPRPESAVNWAHLQKISEKIMPLNEDIEDRLPIGLNCKVMTGSERITAASCRISYPAVMQKEFLLMRHQQ